MKALQPLAAIVDEARRLIRDAEEDQLPLRLIGGLAVYLHCPSMESFGLQREYPDIDFVTEKNAHARLGEFFARNGYRPDKAFNTLNGDRRQLYFDAHRGRCVDIFLGDFEMCHRLPLQGCLRADPLTVPLAELFLSKTQIVELNSKDINDLIALLLDNELGSRDQGQINLGRIVALCVSDWGLYTTTDLNLQKLARVLLEENPGIDAPSTRRVLDSLAAIRRSIQQADKPLKWKARDRIGTRLRWYAEVEEVDR